MIRWPYNWRKKEACPTRIPHIGGVLYRWDTFAENCFIRLAPLPASGVNTEEARQEKVILSLTTFPARIHLCYYAIKSLMLQSRQADRIILWLAEEQFPDRTLPDSFRGLMERGLEVRFCEDLRAHKKYYYALQEQKCDEVVITYDDDIIYEYDSIEKLLEGHKQYPSCIICNRGFEMTTDGTELRPYNQWKLCSQKGVNTPTRLVMPSTGYGCLYPYGVMPGSTFDRDVFQRNAWSADDLWMKFCSLQAGVSVVKTREKIAALVNVYGSQKQSLTELNNGKNENQRTIERLMHLYPNTMENLMESEQRI